MVVYSVRKFVNRFRNCRKVLQINKQTRELSRANTKLILREKKNKTVKISDQNRITGNSKFPNYSNSNLLYSKTNQIHYDLF